MRVKSIDYLDGMHCETTATGTLLRQIGIHLSEPMLFGLGQGLGFIIWNMKTMDFPFLGGRIKTDFLTENLSRNLNVTLTVNQTGSISKAWHEVKNLLDGGNVVGLKLDCYHLEYFSNPFHFAGHYCAIFDYDDTYAYLIDTAQQCGWVRTSLKSLALARSEKGPMSSKNLYYIIQTSGGGIVLKDTILRAVKNNAKDYINPPIKNIGYKGIHKTASEIIKWFDKSSNIEGEFNALANIMERGGTGGALFRNMYRDFLKESFDIINFQPIGEAYHEFVDIARLWTEVSQLFIKISKTQDRIFLQNAVEILELLSEKEKKTMEKLSSI
ncbi:BtrH N-terminal domain-containing protein [Sphingobacterium daejeonense]|uniref:BtrH N-terminal domain-containing protein n=1 Tax=Sphingobacterium daejeonense TaxID=371142 RepID=A0ABW3RN03_9SPHI